MAKKIIPPTEGFNEILLYTTPNGKVKVEIYLQNETIWLTQQRMADLFGVQRPAITKHLKNIFESGELAEEVVSSILEQTTLHGAIEGKTQETKVKYYNLDAIKKYILFFPFCSKDLIHKRWPYFSELISLIKQNHPQYELVVAPGPDEIEEAKSLNIKVALNNNLALNFFELASLIKKSHLVIANDTGPAHMAAHLGAKGFTLFGPHTTPEKVSIEREKFIALQTMDLKSLFPDRVYALIKSSIIS